MKFDDAINGVIAIVFGCSMIVLSQNLPEVRHIDFGPGLFPTLVGCGLVAAGGFLLGRRLFAAHGKVIGWASFGSGDRETPSGGVGSMALQIAVIVFYILTIERLGFLLTMPIVLFCLLAWFDRRIARAAIYAIAGTAVLHSFFYQLMSVPLPWGLLEPYARALTW